MLTLIVKLIILIFLPVLTILAILFFLKVIKKDHPDKSEIVVKIEKSEIEIEMLEKLTAIKDSSSLEAERLILQLRRNEACLLRIIVGGGSNQVAAQERAERIEEEYRDKAKQLGLD